MPTLRRVLSLAPPPLQGLQMVCKHRPGLWELYLEMRQEAAWHGQQLVRRQRSGGSGESGGDDNGGGAAINAPMLAELLQRYRDRPATVKSRAFNELFTKH